MPRELFLSESILNNPNTEGSGDNEQPPENERIQETQNTNMILTWSGT